MNTAGRVSDKTSELFQSLRTMKCFSSLMTVNNHVYYGSDPKILILSSDYATLIRLI